MDLRYERRSGIATLGIATLGVAAVGVGTAAQDTVSYPRPRTGGILPVCEFSGGRTRAGLISPHDSTPSGHHGYWGYCFVSRVNPLARSARAGCG